MQYSGKAFRDMAKAAGEFVARIVATVGVLYVLSRVTDEVLGHVQVHVDRHWWTYRVWHAWWWLIVPLGFVAGGRLWRPRSQRARTLAGGLGAVGVCWLALLGAGASIWPLFYFISHFGPLWGTVAFCCLLPLASIGLAYLFDRARRRWLLIDRLKSEIFRVPDRETDGEISR